MLLASVQEIREELGFDDMQDINSAIKMALNAAEALVGATLRTSFERRTVTDTFFVPRPSVSVGGNHKTEFLLSQGFVTGTPIVTPDNGLVFLNEKGVARDLNTAYSNERVTITYEAGFEAQVSGDPPVQTGSYVLDQVPPWLKEAVKIKVLMMLAKLPAITEAGIELDVKMLDQQYGSLINTHIRYAPAALLPE